MLRCANGKNPVGLAKICFSSKDEVSLKIRTKVVGIDNRNWGVPNNKNVSIYVPGDTSPVPKLVSSTE